MFTTEPAAIEWRARHETLRVEAWGRDALRVRATMAPSIADPFAGVGALLEPGDAGGSAPVTVEVDDRGATIRNGALSASVDRDGRLAFRRTRDGAVLLEEHDRHAVAPRARGYMAGAGELWSIEAGFAAYEGERLYGLGQQQHGRLDLKGSVIDLVQRNTHVVVPFVVSSRGYGFLWHNPAVGRVELAANGTRWTADAAAQIDYWVCAGDSPADILERYAEATGRPPLLPDWATGFWQSNLRYRTQEEVLEVAREHRRRGLPLSVIVIDAGHWPAMGDWTFDPRYWPDPGKMVRELESMGVRAMVSVWPTVNALSRNFGVLRDGGLLVRTARGPAQVTSLFDIRPEGPVALYLYDATNPAARAFLADRLLDGYVRHGIRLFWLDADEPELNPLQPDNVRYDLGPGAAVHNLYPLLHARAVHDGLRETGVDEVITLNRSAWAGSQRYGAAVWSGDVDSSFDALRVQVRAGLQAAMSGIPWWTTDIGGFKGGRSDDPAFRELLVRWFWYAAFCPLFRLHGIRVDGAAVGAGPDDDLAEFGDLAELGERDGDVHPISLETFSGGPNEPWSFGDEAYAHIREAMLVRERLRPYLAAQMRIAHERGLPPMRPLFVDFPDDPVAWTVEDAFMLGPDVLVAPITDAGARERAVYLPAGATWRDAWTDEPAGPGWVAAAAQIDRIPVFLRDGSGVPVRA